MELTFENISPNISNEERKINIESFFNTLCRISNVENFNHCEYETDTNKIHIVVNKSRS
jgi:hypothetical protein